MAAGKKKSQPRPDNFLTFCQLLPRSFKEQWSILNVLPQKMTSLHFPHDIEKTPIAQLGIHAHEFTFRLCPSRRRLPWQSYNRKNNLNLKVFVSIIFLMSMTFLSKKKKESLVWAKCTMLLNWSYNGDSKWQKRMSLPFNNLGHRYFFFFCQGSEPDPEATHRNKPPFISQAKVQGES